MLSLRVHFHWGVCLFVCLFLVYLLWDTSALWIGGEILQLRILLLSSQNDKFHESSCKEMEVS